MNDNIHSKNRQNLIHSMFASAVFGVVLSELSSGVANIVDGIITSRYLGSLALSALGLSGICYSLLSIVSGIISAGAQQIYCSELLDGKEGRKHNTFAKTITLTLPIALLIMVLGIFTSDLLASAVGAPADTGILHDSVRNYMIGVLLGAPAFILTPVLIPAVQLNGDNKLISLSLTVLIATDVLGDLLNVTLFHGGIFGIGLASALSYYASVSVLCISFFKKSSMFKLGLKLPDKFIIQKIFDTGLPKATKRLCNFIRPLFINNMIMLAGGSIAMAAFSVEQNLKNFTEAMGAGIAGASFLMTGVFLREHYPDALRFVAKSATRAIILGVGSFSVLYFLTAPLLARIYLTADSPSFAPAVFVLRCHAVSLPFLAFNEYYFNIVQASRKLKLSHMITVLEKLVFIVSTSFILSRMFGVNGLWLAIPVSEFLLCISILLCTAIRNRKNPMRTSRFSFVDDRDGERLPRVEVTVTSPEDLPHGQEKIHNFCLEQGFSPKTTYIIQLFFEELCMTIIRHGFFDAQKHFIEIRVFHAKDKILLRSTDNCKTFTYQERQMMFDRLEADEYLGINMISKMAKDVNYVDMLKINHFSITIEPK